MPRIDLHVHTRRYSSCAEFLDPEELGTAMARRGIDAVVLTEHDATWRHDELERLRASCFPRRVYSGVELTARDGHVVAIGLGAPVEKNISRSVEETAALVSALGAMAILVHPYTSHQSWGPMAPPCLGAVEVRSTVTHGKLGACAEDLAKRWGLPAVGGSDAHAIDRVGKAWTVVPELPKDEVQLAQLLKGLRGGCWGALT